MGMQREYDLFVRRKQHGEQGVEFISHDHASGKISQHGLNIVAERNGVLVAVLVNVVGQFGKLSAERPQVIATLHEGRDEFPNLIC